MGRQGRWGVVALLFSATLLNYLDRQTVSVTLASVETRAELGIDKTDLGMIFWAFYFAYAVAQIIAGIYIDRTNVKAAYAKGVAGWSLAGAATGFAAGFWTLLLPRVLLGVFESVNWPAALRVVARTFAPSQRALATGIFQSGTSVGALIAPPVIIYLSHAYNWRASFIVVGLVGFVWVAAWLLLYRPGSTDPATATTDLRATVDLVPSHVVVDTTPSSLRQILRSRGFWGLAISAFFLQPCQYFYLSWLPTYFVESGSHFGAELAARLTIVYLVLDLGLIVGGGGVALLARRMPVVEGRRWIITAGAIMMTGIVLVSRLSQPSQVMLSICVAVFGLGFFQANYLTFTAEVSTKRVSTVCGMLGSIGSFSGAFAMLLVGYLSETKKSFAIPFALMGTIPLVALAGIWLGTTRRR